MDIENPSKSIILHQLTKFILFLHLNLFLGGIRMLDGRIDDRIEGESLKHSLDK